MADFIICVLLLMIVCLLYRIALFKNVVVQIIRPTIISLGAMIDYCVRKLKQFYYYIKRMLLRKKFTRLEYTQYADIHDELKIVINEA